MPEENHVSSTSSSCSKVNFAPPASFSARSVASSKSRPTTHDLPSVLYDGHIVEASKGERKVSTYILLLSLDTHEIRRTAMAPPELTRNTPVLGVLQPSEPVGFRLLWRYMELAGPGALAKEGQSITL